MPCSKKTAHNFLTGGRYDTETGAVKKRTQPKGAGEEGADKQGVHFNGGETESMASE
jgi:hypothetical protein